jgi:uncharacterized membrane protein HdeD (DUF308 family)
MLGSTLLITRGIVGIIIGVLAFMWPGLTIAVLVGIFAMYAVIDGITNLMLGLKKSAQGRHWAMVVQGLIGIGAGLLTALWPGITALALVFFIAAWAVLTGIFEIVAAIRLRRLLTGEWLLMLSGVLSIAFGVLVFAFPAAGAVGIAWVLGAYALATGVILVSLGVGLRSRTLAVA